MSSRIDIELTSVREDGKWTWRAASAREPRGLVDASLLGAGAKVGDVLRAEADFEIDGLTIVSVAPQKERTGRAVTRLEILGPRDEPPGADAPSSSRRASRGGGARGARREGHVRRDGDGRREGNRHPRPRERASARGPQGAGPDRGRGQPERRDGSRRPQGSRPSEGTPRSGAAGRPKRLHVGSAHRDEVMRSLSAVERRVAEQVLRGGLPAVRQALEEQNQAARREGRPEVKPDALLGLAEELIPRLKTATWLDRAEAAEKAGGDISLRDLRSLVAGSETVQRDARTRTLAASLRANLEARVAAARQRWLDSVTASLDQGRLVHALELSARPPEPTAKLPAELAARLREASSEALSADAEPRQWASTLEAVAASPVRRVVKPRGLPSGASKEILEAARKEAGRVPSLAPLLGIEMPPPPGPPRRARPQSARQSSRL
jgi:hypothetical protein